jgi:hypothetical protein
VKVGCISQPLFIHVLIGMYYLGESSKHQIGNYALCEPLQSFDPQLGCSCLQRNDKPSVFCFLSNSSSRYTILLPDSVIYLVLQLSYSNGVIYLTSDLMLEYFYHAIRKHQLRAGFCTIEQKVVPSPFLSGFKRASSTRIILAFLRHPQ